jgi:adenylylsulfate kinase
MTSQEKLHIITHNYKITRSEREIKNGHKAVCLWFTGLSGSGKSTLANQVELYLFEHGFHTYILDGDNVRKGLNKDLDFTNEGRIENLRRIGEVAKLMLDAGLIVLAAFVSPFQKERQMLRQLMPDSFIEIFVDASIETCEKRDVKGLYKKAKEGEISNFTGISSPFEKPLAPDIHIHTDNLSIEESVQIIVNTILPKIKN